MRQAAIVPALTVLCALAAPAARAQVAIAPVVQPDDVVARDVVGEVALSLARDHQLLSPQLDPEDVVSCATDVPCLLKKAKAKRASHLVVVSVAPLGARDQVVAATVYSARDGEKLFEENTVLSTTRDLRAEATALGDRVAGVAGLPKKPPPPPAPEPAADAGPGTLTFVGTGMLVGSGVAMIATAVVSSVLLAQTSPSASVVVPTIIVGTCATGALGVGGVVMMLLDE